MMSSDESEDDTTESEEVFLSDTSDEDEVPNQRLVEVDRAGPNNKETDLNLLSRDKTKSEDDDEMDDIDE